MQKKASSGFTLLETAVVVGMSTLLAAAVMPAASKARVEARARGSASNLAFIGQGTAMYAADHDGRLFSFTWEAGLHQLPDGTVRLSQNDGEAASWQQTEILQRRTGRLTGEHKIIHALERIPHRRTLLLVLQDYLERPFPDPMVADPADAILLIWQAHPLDYGSGSGVPYAPGADFSGYDDWNGWTSSGVRQRWAFSSSYQPTTSAWQADGIDDTAVYNPIAATPHLFQSNFAPPLAGGRNFSEVWFPSAKVHMFEEFDREQPGEPYFAYDHARPEKLMFDGSVNDLPSGEARPSWNSSLGKQEWRQTYVALHTFPLPLGGPGDPTLLSQRYRWTFGGLRGLDYAAPVMTRPNARGDR